MLDKNNINKPTLINLLTTEAYLKVIFTKVTTGSIRVMYCTLKDVLIPTMFANSITNTLSNKNDPDLLPVWDINNGGWRSFRISTIISVEKASESRLGEIAARLKKDSAKAPKDRKYGPTNR